MSSKHHHQTDGESSTQSPTDPSTSLQSAPNAPESNSNHTKQSSRENTRGSNDYTRDHNTAPPATEVTGEKAVSFIVEDISVNWQSAIRWDERNRTTNYLFSPASGSRSFAIRQNSRGYFVHQCDGKQPLLENSDSHKKYQSFSSAIAAVLGALEWGTLPPGKPEIWKYEGYDDNGSFGEYLSGSDNESCGSHRFINQKASYTIEIESFADTTIDTNRSKSETTVATLSIYPTQGNTDPHWYQRTFSGQKEAFNHLFELVANELSHIIADLE